MSFSRAEKTLHFLDCSLPACTGVCNYHICNCSTISWIVLYRFLTGPWPRGSKAALFTSRCGLLVLRFVPLEEPSNGQMKTMILALYDPIVGKSCRLPALKSTRHFRIEGYAILTGVDCCPAKRRGAASSVRSSFFKVLIIVDDRDEPRHNLHVFTSTDSGSSWSTPRECLDSLEHDTRLVSQKTSAVVCQGIAHWLFRNTSNLYALNVCAQTTEMSLARLPRTGQNSATAWSHRRRDAIVASLG